MLSRSEEKIFLEPIDQYFEEEFNLNNFKFEKIDNKYKEEDMKKLDKELIKSLNLLEDNDNSTEMDSEESLIDKNKKLLLSNYIYINKENIEKAIINTKNKYIWLIKKEYLSK